MKFFSRTQAFKFTIVSIALVATAFSPRWWVVDAGSDDLLYAKQAVSLLSGNWLGPFQDGAALKLPGFQFFLAISAATHIPYFILLILLQSVFALKFSAQFLRFGFSERTTNLIFGFLVFSPVMYGFSNSRLLRDGFYSVLLLGLVTYCGEIYCQLKESSLNKKKIFLSMFAFTVIGSWLIFTREEGPLVVFIILFGVIALLLTNRGKGSKYRQKLLIGLLVANMLSISSVNLIIVNLNKNYYGINSAAILQSGPLDALIKQWSRVNPVNENPRISVSYQQRSIVYEQIPELGKIASRLESTASFYQDVSCNAAQVCDEVGAGWISWAIFYMAQSELPSDKKGQETMKLLDHWTSLIKRYCLAAESNCSKDIRLPGLGSLQNFPKVILEMPVQIANFAQMKATFDSVGLSFGNQSNADVFRTLISFSGPPRTWAESPIGISFMPVLMLFLSILLIILIAISVRDDKTKNRSHGLLKVYFAMVSFSILIRAFTTAIFEINAVDTKATQYLMPGVALMWDLFLLTVIFVATFSRLPAIRNLKT